MKNYSFFLFLAFFISHSQKTFSKSLETETKENLKTLEVVKKKGVEVDTAKKCADCAALQVSSPSKIKKEMGVLVSPVNNKTLKLSVLTEEEATQMFNKIIIHKEIAFSYSREGCFARAMSMAKIMDEAGIVSGKAVIEGRLFYLRDPYYARISWGYHVSSVVLVKKGTETIPYIIDPTLFKTPVPYDVWKNVLLEDPDSVKEGEYFMNQYAFGPPDKFANKTSFQEKDLKLAKEINTGSLEAYEEFKERNTYR